MDTLGGTTAQLATQLVTPLSSSAGSEAGAEDEMEADGTAYDAVGLPAMRRGFCPYDSSLVEQCVLLYNLYIVPCTL